MAILIWSATIDAVEQEFLRSRKLGLMTVFRNDGQWDASNVEFEDGRILEYSKKNRTPRMRYIDYGLGVFQAEAFAGTNAARSGGCLREAPAGWRTGRHGSS